MIIDIPKEMTWNLPEGRFKARVYDVRSQTRTSNETTIQQSRFIFEVDVPAIKRKQPMAGQSYDVDMHPNSQLRVMLEGWKGKDWVSDRSGQQINLAQLIGEEVDLDLYHVKKGGHKKPLVLIQAVHSLSNN